MSHSILRNALGLSALSAALALVLPPNAAAANLVVNGDFETFTGGAGVGEVPAIGQIGTWTVGATTDAAPDPFVFILDTTADDIPGGGFPSVYSPPNINVRGPDDGVSNGFTGSPTGGYFLGVNGAYATAPVSQNVTVTAGKVYSVTFDQACARFTDSDGATKQQWKVSLGADDAFTSLLDVAGKGFAGWSSFTHNFTATTTGSVPLTFLAIGSPGGSNPFLLLDGIKLEEVAVPEPGTTAIVMLSAACSFALWRRRTSHPTA